MLKATITNIFTPANQILAYALQFICRDRYIYL